MGKRFLLAISTSLLILGNLFAASVNSMFYLRWANKVPENTTITFTNYDETSAPITTKALEITSDSQPAFAAVYSTNRLGNHNIRFTSTQLSSGEASIPYSVAFSCNGKEFSSLVVGTTEEKYVSSVGTITVRRADLSSSPAFASTIYADIVLGKAGTSIDDYPDGDYSAEIQFIVEVQ